MKDETISLVLDGDKKNDVLQYISDVTRLLKNPRFIYEKLFEKNEDLVKTFYFLTGFSFHRQPHQLHKRLCNDGSIERCGPFFFIQTMTGRRK